LERPGGERPDAARGRGGDGWPITIAPSWFDPSTAPPQITPFGILYALHDALVRPLPGQKMGNSLAESWTESQDGLIYEFKLRPGLKFHNGEPVTADDVKFSFERYKGTGAKELNLHVRQVESVDPAESRIPEIRLPADGEEIADRPDALALALYTTALLVRMMFAAIEEVIPWFPCKIHAAIRFHPSKITKGGES
jgi:hypothetical protein